MLATTSNFASSQVTTLIIDKMTNSDHVLQRVHRLFTFPLMKHTVNSKESTKCNPFGFVSTSFVIVPPFIINHFHTMQCNILIIHLSSSALHPFPTTMAFQKTPFSHP